MSGARKLLVVLCLLIAAGAAGFTVYYVTSERDRGQIYDDLQAVASSEPAEEPEVSSAPVEDVPEPYVSTIDFKTLQDVNPDIYAWIEIPDTEVAYPVIQHPEDPIYYLDHTIEGEEGLPGSIYTETGVSKEWADYITVVYGHNMKNGTMFGSLKKYRDEQYLKDHPFIYVYTPEAKYTYQIFASVIYDDRLITSYFDDRDEKDRKKYLDSIFEIRDMNSHILTDVPVTTEDKVLTLSTCISGAPENRYLVEAVLTDVQK